MNEHRGAAEYAGIAAEFLAITPLTLPLGDAAALPLTGLAARQAAVELAYIQAGQSVLVNGAGGAVGSIVVQLAADVGASVTAVSGLHHAARLLGYGASKVVDPPDLDAGPFGRRWTLRRRHQPLPPRFGRPDAIDCLCR